MGDEFEDKVVDNEASRMIVRKFAEDDIYYEKEKTLFFMKIFWIIGSVANLYLVYRFFGGSGFQSHFLTFVMGVLALKIYNVIPPYMDFAEEMGLVKSREDFGEEDDVEDGE